MRHDVWGTRLADTGTCRYLVSPKQNPPLVEARKGKFRQKHQCQTSSIAASRGIDPWLSPTEAGRGVGWERMAPAEPRAPEMKPAARGKQEMDAKLLVVMLLFQVSRLNESLSWTDGSTTMLHARIDRKYRYPGGYYRLQSVLPHRPHDGEFNHHSSPS